MTQHFNDEKPFFTYDVDMSTRRTLRRQALKTSCFRMKRGGEKKSLSHTQILIKYGKRYC